MVRPNFIVGTGYIPEGDEIQSQYVGVGVFGSDADGYIHSKVYRRNAFMVARDYIHAETNAYIMMGMVNDQHQTDISHWVSTTDNKEHRELYLEVTEGSLEVACNDPNDETLDTSDYQQYHTSHIGLSNNRMVIGRFTDRSKDADKSCLAAINFYDKNWFEDHGDVNNRNMPRNTALELLGENAIRELKTNFNITNGLVTKDGYICTSRYAPEGSYAVWKDNVVANGLYADSEYIAISSANTLSLYSANMVHLASKSKVYVAGPRLEISPSTSTIGTLALTGNGKSHCHDWVCGCATVDNKKEPDFARVMYAGFLIATANDVHYGCANFILPERDGTCWGIDEFAAGGSVSAHIFSSVGGDNKSPDYDASCKNESVKLILPGPGPVDHIHPVMMRYREAEVNADGQTTKAEIMQVDKLALMDDIVIRRTMQCAFNDGTTTINTTRWVKIANFTVPAPVNGIQCYVAGSFSVMASGSKGCAKREVHFNAVGLLNAGGSVNISGHSIDSTGRITGSQNACGKVKAVPTNQPSLTTPALYEIWMEVYNLDFISIYPSSFTEGQGTIKWTNGILNVNAITDANLVRRQEPTGTAIVGA